MTTSETHSTVSLRPPVWLPIFVVIIGGFFYLAGKNVEARATNPATVTVSGEGKVETPPTVAQLNFGVTTGPQKTAKDAMTKLQTDMNQILTAIKSLSVVKIDEKDIRTEQFSLNPQYDWKDGIQTLRGYEAMQTLVVKVRDLDKVGSVLSAATTAGANQSSGINFVIDDPEKARAEAREKAIDQAKEKAAKLADTLGMRLGAVRGFGEDMNGVLPPMPYAKVAMDSTVGMGGGGAIELPAGQQEVRVMVSLTYELR